MQLVGSLPIFLLAWTSALVISLVVAALFVLTPNAISYEGLLLLPVLLLSGVVVKLSLHPALDMLLSYLNPLYVPTNILLYGEYFSAHNIVVYILGLLSWLSAAYAASCFAFKQARIHANLELM